MKVFLRSRLIPILFALALIASSVAIPLVLTSSHSHAAAPLSNGQAALAALSAELPFTSHPLPQSSHTVKVGHPTISINLRDAGRLLYVDAGSCPGDSTGDSIDVYRIFSTGLVHVGNFPTGGCLSFNELIGGGTQDLDVTPANGTHGPCLVYTDITNGYVSSFPILPSGGLDTRASHLSLGILPLDIHISRNGKLVYLDSVPDIGHVSVLSSYSLGAGCVLTALSSLPIYSHLYISVALVNESRLTTVDSYTGTIDTYALTENGGISLLNSVPGQLTNGNSTAPVSVTTIRTRNGQQDFFTGQLSNAAPHVQGGQMQVATGALSFLRNSPASDLSGINGTEIFADNDHLLLIQGEIGSNSLGVYSITSGPGHLGNLAFLQHTSLAPHGGGIPLGFTRLDNTLFVAAGLDGDVEACLITNDGVSGCDTAAVLTDPTGIQGGVVLL